MDQNKLVSRLVDIKKKIRQVKSAEKSVRTSLDYSRVLVDRIQSDIDKVMLELKVHSENIRCLKMAPVIKIDEWTSAKTKQLAAMLREAELRADKASAEKGVGDLESGAKTMEANLETLKDKVKEVSEALKKAKNNVYLMSDYEHIRRKNEDSNRP